MTAEGIVFPCRFPIKAMGENAADLEALVLAIVRQHVADEQILSHQTRPSRAGKYCSVTVTIEAESQHQLDRIYGALTAESRILMAL